MTKEPPIIFNTAMVQALLAGRKTQTRRLAWEKNTPEQEDAIAAFKEVQKASRWQHVKIGDRIWVQEDFDLGIGNMGESYVVLCRAGNELWIDEWIDARKMKREDSRIILTVTDVRLERLQDITEEDAVAEGLIPVIGPLRTKMWEYSPMEGGQFGNPRAAYLCLWHSLYGEGIDANPEVVALTFTTEVKS